MKGLHSEFETLRDKLKGLLKPANAQEEERVRADIEKVGTAARLLQITEFNFFHLAYFQWHGREASASVLENVFSDYMFQDVVPHWVRHFTRIVTLQFDQGVLDPQEYSIEIPQTTLELKSAGYGYSAIIDFIMIIFCAMFTGHIPMQ